MKKIALIVLTILMVVPALQVQAQKNYDQFEVQVDGLGCPFCAYGLEKKFKEFKGIKKVKIDIETGDFSFTYPSEKALTIEAVEQQVKKAGYTPMTGSVTRFDGTVEEMKTVQKEAISADADLVTESVFVAGNCEMCQVRIEKASTDISGVATALWNKDTKLLEVSYDTKTTNLSKIEKSVAKAGHDTKNHKAKNGAYKDLPACCAYERVEY
ncbi:MAG: mercuric ion binding protein [Dokdonia sp.]|jgi:mercuric ion binding protein